MVCAGVAGVTYVYAAYAADQAAPTRPFVTHTGTFPDEQGLSGQPLIVFGHASDPDGIVQIELWVNGRQVAVQDNPDKNSSFPFVTSQAWIPTGPGNYLALFRALDRRGFKGDSEPFIVQVADRHYNDEAGIRGEYITQEGETIETIAATFGLSPEELREHNPGLEEISPGISLDVPHIPEGGDGGGTGISSAASEEGIPLVDPPEPPSSTGESAVEAEPLSEDWWTRLPVPSNFGCLLRPDSCRTAIEAVPAPFPAPDRLSVTTGSCFNVVSWQDNSENEQGFRLYRFTMRPRFRYEMIALLEPAAGSGSRVSYNDTLLPIGTFFYAVVAYNAGGQTWSEASEEVANDCPPPDPGEAQPMVVEGLEMEVVEGFDRLYCYTSLNHSPFERIPYATSDFIEIDAGSWNIAEHFSGRNKRSVLVSSDSTLPVLVECLGWQGDELINLGRFEKQHPPEEWDGRPLVSSPESGLFALTYRILPSFAAAHEGGRTDWPLIDPAVAPPFNLREIRSWESCTLDAGGFLICGDVFEPGITWDFIPPDWEAVPYYEPRGFKVYRRLDGGRVPSEYYTVLDGWPDNAPLYMGDCGPDVFYSVSAIIGVDPVTGEEIHTPLSEEFSIPSCTTLEITLIDLSVPQHSVSDGDVDCGPHPSCQRYEAYGWFSFNGRRIVWNNHCDPGAFGSCLGPGPSTTSVRDYGAYWFDDKALNTGGGWRTANNVIQVPIQTGEKLTFTFQLWDHDSTSGDDLWCGSLSGRSDFSWTPAYELGVESWEWTGFDETFNVSQASFEDFPWPGDITGCTVRVRVKALSP